MGEIFEYWPIILGVLYFLFGGKKKKDQPKTPRKRPNPQSPTSSLEDILRELAGETKAKAKPKAPKPVVAPIPKKENAKIEMVDHSYDFTPEYEHHADTGKSLKEIREDIVESKTLVDVNSFDDVEYKKLDFDLRDAIIYDAILNRPEY